MSSFDFNRTPGGPPLTPQPIGERSRAQWPSVVGIIGIVLASLGLLANACGAIYAAIVLISGKVFMGPMGPGASGAEFEKLMETATLKHAPVNAVVGLVGVVASAWLLIGSIMLTRRSPRAAMLRWWALLAIAFVLVATIAQAMQQSELMGLMSAAAQKEAQAGSSPSQAAQAAGMMNTVSGFVVILTVLWGIGRLIFPVFVLIWMSRATVRDEMAGWGVPSTGAER